MTPEQLAVDLAAVADEIADLRGTNQIAADTVLGAVRPPRLTGALAGTVAAVVDATGFGLTVGGSAAPYGPIVHARDPFLTRALTDREAAVVALYVDHLQAAVNP